MASTSIANHKWLSPPGRFAESSCTIIHTVFGPRSIREWSKDLSTKDLPTKDLLTKNLPKRNLAYVN